MRQLICINVLIIALDIGLLGIEYASLFLLETILKGFVYSIKLKFEFAILGRLVDAVGGRDDKPDCPRNSSFAMASIDKAIGGGPKDLNDIAQFVDLQKVNTDYKFAACIDGTSQRKVRSVDFGIQHTENVDERRI
jgi:hypothetical protein